MKSTIYLSEKTKEEDMPVKYLVSVVGAGVIYEGGYATESEVKRILRRARKRRPGPTIGPIFKWLTILLAVLVGLLCVSLPLVYPAELGNDNTGAGGIQFVNVTNSGTITIALSPVPLQKGGVIPMAVAGGKDIQAAEGLRLTPYTDQTGAVHIGYGRNLTGKGITRAEAEILFKNDLSEAETDLSRNIFAREWAGLPEKVQEVLINMRYQLGPEGFRGFVDMIAAVRAGDWPTMAKEMKESRWATIQTPERATHLIKIIESMTTKKEG